MGRPLDGLPDSSKWRVGEINNVSRSKLSPYLLQSKYKRVTDLQMLVQLSNGCKKAKWGRREGEGEKGRLSEEGEKEKYSNWEWERIFSIN